MSTSSWPGDGSWPPAPRSAVVSRGARAGLRSGAILGGVVGSLLSPVGGTVFGALAGAAVGVGFGLGTGVVLSVIDVTEHDRTRVRWAATFTSGTAAVLLADAIGLSGVLAAVLFVACGLLAAIDAPRVAFGPSAPWQPRRPTASGGSAVSEILDWTAGGVAAGLSTGLSAGAVVASLDDRGAVATVRSVLDWAVGGVLPGLVVGAVVGAVMTFARRRRPRVS